ncbi:MAG: 3-deoxy-8-phosphooctulonate synthase, partial [Planctomycetia bacterium]
MNPRLPAVIGRHHCGPGCPLLVIAGPCVIESESLCLRIAESRAVHAPRRSNPVGLKAAFDHANPPSGGAGRGRRI